jgi:hypothetical protein
LTRISRRTVLYAPIFVGVLGALAIGTTAYSFVRLTTNDGNNVGLHWAPNAQPVPFTIQAQGSKDVPDQSGAQAIRLAFDTWSQVPGAGLRFAENASHASMPKTHANDGVNLVFFDETDATGLFVNADFIIAITPVFFDGSGNLLDADIVFNGAAHSFSTNLSVNTYDIQSIATHEIGHFLGLDHAGIYGATMIPFAFEQDTRLRSLAQDDIAGITSIYPAGTAAPLGRIQGQVLLDGSSGATPVDGAHVVVVNPASGEPQSSTLTLADGSFSVEGLEPGNFRVYVEPLDGPTTGANLQRGTGSVMTGFTTTFVGGVATPAVFGVGVGSTMSTGAIHVQARSGFNISGVIGGQSQVLRGSTANFQLTGDGLVAGLDVEVDGPGIHLSGGSNTGTLLAGAGFQVAVDAGAPTGIHDIYVFRTGPSGREMVALPGGLEVRATPPILEACLPGGGATAGGDPVTLSGSNFAPGARVLFGDQIATQVVVQSASSIAATTPGETAAGTVAVIVINPDGQQATLASAFTFSGPPAPTPPPPAPGTTSGGSGAGSAASGTGGGGGGGGGCAFAGAPGAAAPAGALLPHLLALAAIAIIRRRVRNRSAAPARGRVGG